MHKLNRENYFIKRYLHFDSPIHISKVESYVQNRSAISRHSFFPLIHYVQLTEKFTLKEHEYTDGRPFQEKERPIKYAGHLDGYIYKYYAEELNRKYNQWAINNGIDDCAIAYRNNKPGYSNINFAAEVISFIHKIKDAYIIVGDFSNYFESLNHQLLKERMLKVSNSNYLNKDWYNIFKSVTKYGYIKKEQVENYFGKEKDLREVGKNKFPENKDEISEFKKEYEVNSNKAGKGIPQGVSISAIMANVYAMDFDKKVNQLADEHNGIYRRYSDDFILVIPKYSNKKEFTFQQMLEFKNKLYQYAEEDELEISEEKTHTYKRENDKICEFHENSYFEKSKLDYLGFVYNGKDISIRQRSIEKFYSNMKKLVKKAKYKLRTNSKKENRKSILKRIPYRNSIYGLYTDKGFKNNKCTNFIEYVKRSQRIFDTISSETNNKMLEQIKNRKKKIERLLGSRIYVRKTDN